MRLHPKQFYFIDCIEIDFLRVENCVLSLRLGGNSEQERDKRTMSVLYSFR